MEELPVPRAAQSDSQAHEVLRFWIAGDENHCVLQPECWDDPACWGIALADVIRHVVHALGDRGKDKAKTMARVLAGLRAELNNPTDEPMGDFQ